MKVTIVGAGPAGLYFALLLKKVDPAHEITVWERNAPDATFGWGVVFSEETMGALRDADYPTYLEITDTFARWDAIDIRYRDQRIRSRGHAFSAIRRTVLLGILQRRCAELGVRLEFRTEIPDPLALSAESDLVVAADGVNSATRQAAATEFGSSIRPQGCKYAWFGTDLVLDAFTFVFRETEHGLFQVHAYPFDERASTFIVECPEDTWRRAGLDQADEAASIAFCERLFAEDLRGHRLLSNRSTWNNFLRVRNRSWHKGNVVLVGDAAHTAHFTIGSGTKLAMEDAIALANAFVGKDDVAAALTDYELERQPVVERFQQAADDSAAYFARVARHTGLEPRQFAFNLLTRSGRISHANLAIRDADFVRRLDAQLAGAANPASAITPPPMFTPWPGPDSARRSAPSTPARSSTPSTVAQSSTPSTAARFSTPSRPVLRNRIVRTGADRAALVAAARDGAGLVLTRSVAVSPAGRRSPDCPVLAADSVAEWSETVAEVHAAGAAVAMRLGHAGRRGATRPARYGRDIPLPGNESWPLLSASAIRYAPGGAVPAEATAADLDRVRQDFADAAGRAAECGVDVLELDAAHGGLLASFLSPLSNRRTDDFGGSAENRLRFPLSVLAAVRAVWPEDRPLAVRLSVTDWARGGVDEDAGIELARAVAEHGADLVHVAAGQTVAESQPVYRRGFLTALSDRVRSEAGVATLVGGHLTTPDAVNTVLGAGRADLCLLDLPEPDEAVTSVGP